MKNAQRGSVLVYILIAIALLGALSYAIARSSRGNVGQLTAEKARLLATELLEYANAVASGVSQIKLRGVKPGELCFSDAQASEDYDYAGCDDDYNKIYNVKGAGISWTKIPAEATQASATPDYEWHVYGDNEIKGVGTSCGDEDCTDLLLVAMDLDKGVCMKLNELLNVTGRDIDPPTDDMLGTVIFKGVFEYNNTIGNVSAGAALADKSAGCFKNTGDNNYIFYKVLLSR